MPLANQIVVYYISLNEAQSCCHLNLKCPRKYATFIARKRRGKFKRRQEVCYAFFEFKFELRLATVLQLQNTYTI